MTFALAAAVTLVGWLATQFAERTALAKIARSL